MDATSLNKLDTPSLKKFAQAARRTLIRQVSAKLDQVLAESSAARREQPQAVKELEKEITNDGRDQVVERVAYTWFNRFSALRFMDANGYTRVRVVSPADGQTRPEILAEAAGGHIDEDVPDATRQKVSALLDGRSPSRDPQAESYRLLLVAACNGWHGVMPFLFEKIADYTELLMPDDLLSANSILAGMRGVMTEVACRDVEIIGWLYQFYISEKKDEVFAGLKKNKKITPENIPAATQLFTPHWIVRYLVENSLGRLWMLNRPNSRLRERMDYYIEPEQPEGDFLRIPSPEEIKVCDPACGSGHMLTYAFDLLYAIYEEEGYDTSEIPSLILTKNLYGIEIDERAGALAAFALMMKARGVQRRFLRRNVTPNICVLENISFHAGELAEYIVAVGHDLFTADLRETLGQFGEAKNFGSLIVPRLKDPAEVARLVTAKDLGSNLFLREVNDRVHAVLRMAKFLLPQYHVVVANPPYAGSKGLNARLAAWLTYHFPSASSDLMTAFMDRCRLLSVPMGNWGMINLPSWMFLGSYRKLRTKLLNSQTIVSLVHLGRGVFGADFGAVAFSVQNRQPTKEAKLTARRLFEKFSIVRTNEEIERLFRDPNFGNFKVKQDMLTRIPDEPIAYWLSENAIKTFSLGTPLASIAAPKQGIKTGDNERFLRFWHEVSTSKASLDEKAAQTAARSKKWFPCTKGGQFRRWYGNCDYLLNWKDDGEEIRNFKDEDGKLRSRPQNTQYFFVGGVTWSSLTIGSFSARLLPRHFAFESKGSASPSSDEVIAFKVLGFLNSAVVDKLISALSPTVDYSEGAIGRLPIIDAGEPSVRISKRLISLSRVDWDAYETSWQFTALPLVALEPRRKTLEATYNNLRTYWRGVTEEMQTLEEQNNRIFIDAYGLQDELTPDVPIEEITLICNPAYRYGGRKSEAELEDQLRADTMREFVSYAVGCMFGRYSLDEPGLILANQGEGFEDYIKRVPEPTFPPDQDNVIPILDGDWFADDIADRFRRLLRVTFGEENFAENLAFIESALGKDIRRYFLRDFYDDHVRRYRKRPIYWMFSSPKGSFNALIYMHRYRPGTVGVVLNGYLREYRSKIAAHRAQLETISISADASQAEKTKAIKEIERLGTVIEELDAYERDVLYPLATQRIDIDLDDGVKVNYAKFGNALKPIKGLGDADD
ncbi:BREX-1 system adenine-specific DNA-methyltransferase PglX [Mesorhizobium sp.]|uniref:BREX-1 system adenine-specific DNA-methyltransferase PglX n=1 Tax=Mesorhizobium sp. TaxID=1871066 RepID=UPI000FE62E8A|nr:BREX-1 system adenine-specific DNA-methyltransferase PglX [Mesorhizobium sp.]RWM07957.1 MAG: BREX-1 system adenine-specific DNA-methyltransferase PglX [Mesorhizobium sp.]